jgi:hypothetical protein
MKSSSTVDESWWPKVKFIHLAGALLRIFYGSSSKTLETAWVPFEIFWGATSAMRLKVVGSAQIVVVSFSKLRWIECTNPEERIESPLEIVVTK